MALSILYGKRFPLGQIGIITLDLTLRENHMFKANVTNFPVEDGRQITDHVITLPFNITLEGLITDTPLRILSPFNRSVETFNRLIDLWQEREPFTLITGIRRYSSMVITELQVPRNITTGQSLTFFIEMQQVIIDTNVRFIQNEDDLFGGTESKIPADIVSSGENIPLIQNDPTNSLRDQGASGINFGLQTLRPIPPEILTNVQESFEVITA
jgi:hypothetical protein